MIETLRVCWTCFSLSLQAPLPPLGKAKLGSAGGSKKGLPPLKRSLPQQPPPAAPAPAVAPAAGSSISASAASIPPQSLAVPERISGGGGNSSPRNQSRESSPVPQRRQWGDAKPLSLAMSGQRFPTPYPDCMKGGMFI